MHTNILRHLRQKNNFFYFRIEIAESLRSSRASFSINEKIRALNPIGDKKLVKRFQIINAHNYLAVYPAFFVNGNTFAPVLSPSR